jgi:hypothetical protein
MKVPLRFQVTECDCGTASLTNAVSYLFEREEIPAGLIKAITLYTLDQYSESKKIGGTSRHAMDFLAKWITSYANTNDMGLICHRYEKEEVTLDKMKKCIDEKGTILVRLFFLSSH